MIYTLEDFIREYRKIKEMGWSGHIAPGRQALARHWKTCWALKKTIMMRRTSGNMS